MFKSWVSIPAFSFVFERSLCRCFSFSLWTGVFLVHSGHILIPFVLARAGLPSDTTSYFSLVQILAHLVVSSYVTSDSIDWPEPPSFA